MAKTDKRMIDRVAGMIYALDVVKTKGVEALEKDISFRRITYMPLEVDNETVNTIMEKVFTNIYNSYGVAMLKVLNEKFGFGGKRFYIVQEEFNNVARDIATTDHYGELLYTFRDYAEEYNRRYGKDGIHFDLDKIEEVDTLNKRSYGQGVNMTEVQTTLHQYGYHDAANFLAELMQGGQPMKSTSEKQLPGQMCFEDYPGLIPEEG